MCVTNPKQHISASFVLCLLCCLFLSACGKENSNRLTERSIPSDTASKSEQEADLSFLSGKSLLFFARMQDEVMCYVTEIPDANEKTAYFYTSNAKHILREVALSEKANYFFADETRLFAIDQFDGIDGRIYQHTVSGTEDTSYSYTEGIQVLPELESEFRWQDTVTGAWHCRFENKLVIMNATRQDFLFRSIGELPAQTYLVDLLTGEKRAVESLSGDNMPVEISAFVEDHVMTEKSNSEVNEYMLKDLSGRMIHQWTYARGNADGGKTSSTAGSFLVIYDWKSNQMSSGATTVINCADSTEKTVTFQSAVESRWVKVSPDSAFVLTYDLNQEFSLYDVNSGQCVKTFAVQNAEPSLQPAAVHFDIQGREIYIQTQQNDMLGVTIATY